MNWPLSADELKRLQHQAVRQVAVQAEKVGRLLFSAGARTSFSLFRRRLLSAVAGMALCGWLIVLIMQHILTDNPVRLVSWLYAALAFITGCWFCVHAWQMNRRDGRRNKRRPDKKVR